MLKNYLKTAIRNFQKNKIYTGINMFGLSISLAFATLVFLFIKDELSYDKFHKNANSIYSVINRDNYFNYNYRYVPNAVGPGMKEFFPELKHAVRITGQNAVVKHGDIIFNERINFVEPAFFKIFSFKLIQGNDDSVLESENSIVLTRSAAAKYFGSENPMGKILSCTFGQKHKDFLVSGITEDVPSNSTVQYEMLININNYKYTRDAEALSRWIWPRSHLYIQLKEGSTPQQIESRLPYFVQQNFKQVEEERRNSGTWLQEGATIEYWLQNMNDIYLDSKIIAGNKFSDIRKSLILGGIGLLVLIIACINFTNLSIGRASSRAIEIGLRKVLGAERRNLIFQFWIESIVIVVISMFIGLVLAVLLLPLFNDIATKNLNLKDLVNVTNLLLFTFSGFLVGVAAGCFPGLALSRFQPVEIIKGKLKIGGKNLITKSLIVVQFSVSIFLIIATITMGEQIKYINNKDLGFEKEGIVIIKTMKNDYQVNEKIANFYKNKANNLEEIISVSGCVFPFATTAGEGMWEFNG